MNKEDNMVNDPSNKITILSVTHFTEKLEKNSHLEPPSVKLYEKTLNSLYNCLPECLDCDKILLYDMPKDPEQKHIEYKRNLKKYCQESGIKIIIVSGEGLRSCVKKGLEQIDTPYTFFLEHDWEVCINESLSNIITEFEVNSKLNYLRFNKRVNKIARDDKIIQEGDGNGIPLTKTSTYSNNPHICRTKVYKEWVEIAKPSLQWISLVPLSRYRSLFWLFREIILKRNSSADAIEHIMSYIYEGKIEKSGFEDAHEEMGIYLYGRKGEGPFVYHLGE